MKRAQLLIYDDAGRLAEQLAELAHTRSLWLREVRHAESCLNLLRQNPCTLVLKVGVELERELPLLNRVKQLFPASAVIIVCDADHPALAGLCWDLGASYVLMPPQPLERLPEIVARFFP